MRPDQHSQLMTPEELKIQQALLVLDCQDIEPADFEAQLKKKYYERAFELHPDRNGSNEAFQELSGAYQYLLSIYRQKNEFLIKQFSQIKTHYKESSSDLFGRYKKACQNYSAALAIYFEKVNQVTLDPGDPDYVQLCENIREIKKEFFQIVRQNPGEAWVADCIEKIHRINVWLKSRESAGQ